ncbi:MAG: sigma-70 family RNA polymerase sigma factor [Chloroflexota bacterium]
MDSALAVLPDETTLVAQAKVEPAAFAAIYDHYFSRVYNYVRYRLADAQAADDVTAQIFERTLANIGRYQPERVPFAAWLFAIARNTVSDHLRAERRRRWLSLDILRDQPDGEPQPEQVAIQDEARLMLLAAAACLSDRERDLIALKFAAGLTNRHMAELAGLSESNVGVTLFRAMRKLRAELERRGVKP